LSLDNGPIFESKECIDEISKIISRGAIRLLLVTVSHVKLKDIWKEGSSEK
jgi:hypothetical protein